ncbi:hypothetical protein T08_11433 [Trichinella sp. T8]|nr:hypothetical protein T08_11433 [Trichinella sp. T8]
MLNNISIATDEKQYSINKVEEASNCNLIISQSLGQSASQSVNQSVSRLIDDQRTTTPTSFYDTRSAVRIVD